MTQENQNFVSVIMPAYNSAQYVAEAIESIVSQSHHNWELIAIDDGSTDGTGQIMDAYAAKDFRIKVIHIANCGVSHARNLGLDAVNGDWIAFLDSDDKYTPDALEKLLANSEGCDLVVGGFQPFPGNRRAWLLPDAVYESPEAIKADFTKLQKGDFFGKSWGSLFRKSTLKARFDVTKNYAEDTLFFLENLKSAQKIRTRPSVVYRYRENVPNSLSQPLNIDLDQVERVCAAFSDYFRNERSLEIHWISNYISFLSEYVKAIWSETSLDEDEKSRRTLEALKRKFFQKIPFQNYLISPNTMRIFVLLKTGDMALIKREMHEQFQNSR